MKIRNTLIIFIVSGFWHGANWTFIIWGLLNAIYIMPSILFKTNRNNLDTVAKGKYLPTLKEFISMAVTFSLTVFAWIFFRSDNLREAYRIISKIFSKSLFTFPEFDKDDYIKPTILLIVLFVFIEWLGREKQYAIQDLFSKYSKPVRWMFYFTLTLIIYYFSISIETQQFIYFQF